MKGKPNTVKTLMDVSRFDLPGFFRWVLVLILYLITFSALDQLAQTLQLFPGVVAWYPPDGLSLAFILTFGAGFAPVFALASLISSLIIYRFSAPLAPILIWAIILSSVYGINALLLRRRIRIDPQLRNLRDILWLILTSAIVSTLLALISVTLLVNYGEVQLSQYFNAFIEWWIGEMIGVLVFTPFMLVHLMPGLKRFIDEGWKNSKKQNVFRRPSLQSIGQVISIPVGLYLVFGIPALKAFQPFYLMAGPLIWMALKNGFSRVSWAIVATNFGTILAIGLFKFDTSHLAELQFLMFGVYTSALLTGAVVTKQKKTEEELRQREIRNRALIENAPDAIALLGADGLLKYTSPSTQRIMGYAQEEWVGSNPEKWTHPDDLPGLLKLLGNLIATEGAVITTQYRFRHKDGSWRWLESTIKNLLAEPSVQALVFNFRDITERKQAEEEIASMAKFPSENPNIVLRLSQDGIVMYANAASSALLNMWGCTTGGSAPQFWCDLVAQVLASKENKTVDIECAGRFYSIVATPVSEPRYVNLYGRDITERKQAEEEIRTSNDELSMLFELSHSLAEADNLEDILNLINRHAVESIHTTFARIALLENGKFILRAAYPIRPLDHDLGIGDRTPVTSLPYTQRVLEKKEPMIFQASDPRISNEEKKVLLLDFAQSLCMIPLRISDSSPSSVNLLGLLMLGEARSEVREPFTPRKMRLAQTIGDSAAIAIRRMLLREQTEARLRQLIALSEIDQAIISSSDAVVSLDIFLLQTLEQLKVDAADVWLFNPASQVLEFVSGRGFRTPAFENAKPLQLGEGNAGRAVLEQRTIHIPNLAVVNDNPRLAKALAMESFVSYYAVPLFVKGQVKGVLELFHRAKLEPNEEWLKFLHILANQASIAIDNSSLFNELQRSNIELIQAYDATIQGWSRALDLRDKETEGHTQRVTELTIKLGRQFGLTEDELVHVRRGALLHDIGKMGVPDGILLKPGSLTDEEWVAMRKHPTFAYEMLSPIHYLRPALDIPYCHHEKWDGKGYPRGLSGEQIPFAARIFAVVDVWDALTSDRPYRAAWPEEKVLDHIRSLAGTHFDPQVVKICLESGLLNTQMEKRIPREPVQWSEEFSVGVREMDQQHQQLIKMLNRLVSAKGTTNANLEMVTDILLGMTRYAQAHFKAEESLMEAHGFPGLEEQKKQHRDFYKKIDDFSKAITLWNDHIPEALLEYLADWLVHHILEEDMGYRLFFKDKGIE